MPKPSFPGSPGSDADPVSKAPAEAAAPSIANVSRPLRDDLRRRLLADRAAFAGTAGFGEAERRIQALLRVWLERLEPTTLGLYWPVRGEFSAGVRPFAPCWPAGTPLALPAACRPLPDGTPARMAYHRFRGPWAPRRDEYGLPTADGPVCEPDVLLVPCVGFTAEGHRLGYGGGFFDRYRAAHPGVTALGVAWSGSRLAPGEFEAEPHDQPLDLVVTEDGVLGG